MKTLNTSLRLLFSLILVLGSLLTSCDPKSDDNDDSFNPINTIDEGSLDLGLSIQRDFMGRIVDETNLPIENVVVTIGLDVVSTDANGMFIINNADVKERQAFIVAEKTGYLKGMRSVVPTAGTNTVRFMLVPENIVATVASGADSEVNLPNGTTVKFDGAFKDENGNAYSGNVDVIMYHLDPSNPSIDDIMPGSLQAQNDNGDERVLESYGMLNVELRGASGEELNIADGHVAEIELPVDPAQSGVAPSTIPLWHFDEVNGYWIEGGQATLVGEKYIAEVSHFSWWNCDAQFPTVALCLNVVDTANVPLSNVRVELWRSGATYPRVGVSDASGEICGLIPANEILTLKAFDQCGVEVHNMSIGPFATDTNYGDIVFPVVTASIITGNLVDCFNANVTNGYAAITYGSDYTAVNITNGSFSLSVIECASLPTYSLEGVDFDTFQTTTALPFNFSNLTLGNLIACTAVTEYITIQIDNDPVDYYLTDINAGQNGGSYFSANAKNASGDSFYFGGNTITPGTYTMSSQDFWIESSTLDLNYNIPNTITFTLNNYGAIGQYIDLIISGTYTDNSGSVRTIAGTVHVLRDN
ncbi:MAG: hypothetical protein ABJK28_08390 [Algibacter sp.]